MKLLRIGLVLLTTSIIFTTLFCIFSTEIEIIENPPKWTYYIINVYIMNKETVLYIAGGSLVFQIFMHLLKKHFKYSKIRKAKKKNLNYLSWREFEQLTQQLYKKRGYKSEIIGGNGGDGGIDVLLKRGGKKWIVQCKHWKTSKVGVKIVRELFGVMIHEKADGVKIIATSGFTKEAYVFAKGKRIELISGDQLMSML